MIVKPTVVLNARAPPCVLLINMAIPVSSVSQIMNIQVPVARPVCMHRYAKYTIIYEHIFVNILYSKKTTTT